MQRPINPKIKSDLAKIINFINSQNFKLIKDNKSSLVAYFDRTRKTIVYNPTKIKRDHLVLTLLHECGHLMDYVSLEDKADLVYDKLKKSRIKMTNLESFNKSDRDCLLSCEKTAWINAFNLAKKLRIRLNSEFKIEQECCLNSYVIFFNDLLRYSK